MVILSQVWGWLCQQNLVSQYMLPTICQGLPCQQQLRCRRLTNTGACQHVCTVSVPGGPKRKTSHHDEPLSSVRAGLHQTLSTHCRERTLSKAPTLDNCHTHKSILAKWCAQACQCLQGGHARNGTRNERSIGQWLRAVCAVPAAKCMFCLEDPALDNCLTP